MRRLLAILVAFLVVAGGEASAENWSKGTREDVLIKQGAVRLTASQVRSLLVGSTEAAKYERSKWAVAYYAPDGSMYVKLPSGKRATEKYQLRPDGRVCYDKSFSKCHYFLRLRGELVAVRSGRVLGVATIAPGKRL